MWDSYSKHQGPFHKVAEGMGVMLLKAKDTALIGCLLGGQRGDVALHLQFVDDTISFSSTNWEEIASL